MTRSTQLDDGSIPLDDHDVEAGEAQRLGVDPCEPQLEHRSRRLAEHLQYTRRRPRRERWRESHSSRRPALAPPAA